MKIATNNQQYITSLKNETIDQISLRAFGNTDATEQILMINQNLSEYGLFLPFGITVNLPPMAKAKSIEINNFWN